MIFNRIIGVACIGLSILMAIALPNRDLDILTCDASSQICNVQRFSWRGVEMASIPVSNLREAVVERKRQKDERVTYLLVIYTNQDRIPVSYNGTLLQKEKLASHVNKFIENPKANSFSERIEHIHWAKWIFSAIIAGWGLKKLKR